MRSVYYTKKNVPLYIFFPRYLYIKYIYNSRICIAFDNNIKRKKKSFSWFFSVHIMRFFFICTLSIKYLTK
jgi:hypothetical protein